MRRNKSMFNLVAPKMLLVLFLIQGRLIGEEIDPILTKYNLKVESTEPITIKIGTLAPTGTPWIDFVYNKLIPVISKESKGLLKIQVYAGGVMGEDTDILRKMKLGQLQGCGCTALGIFQAAPETTVLTLPMLFQDYSEVDHILEKFRPEIDAIFEKHGYYLAGLIDTGFFYLYTKNNIPNLEELKKQKVLTWFGEVEVKTLEGLGINPIKISVPEIVTSLQTGVINANIGPPTWQMGTQAYTQTRYYLNPPWFYSIAAIILEKQEIDKIGKRYPPGLALDIVRMSQRVIRRLEEEWRREIRNYEARCIHAFENSGMKRIDISQADLDTLKLVAQKVKEQLSGKLYSKDLLVKIEEELKNFRSKK